MVLTKRLITTWDVRPQFTPESEEIRLAYLNNIVDQGKTDGKWTATSTSFQMDFVDQASAEAYATECVKWNPGRNLVNASITDI